MQFITQTQMKVHLENLKKQKAISLVHMAILNMQKEEKTFYFKGKILADADYESFGMKYNHEKDVYEIRDKK